MQYPNCHIAKGKCITEHSIYVVIRRKRTRRLINEYPENPRMQYLYDKLQQQ